MVQPFDIMPDGTLVPHAGVQIALSLVINNTFVAWFPSVSLEEARSISYESLSLTPTPWGACVYMHPLVVIIPHDALGMIEVSPSIHIYCGSEDDIFLQQACIVALPEPELREIATVCRFIVRQAEQIKQTNPARPAANDVDRPTEPVRSVLGERLSPEVTQ